MTFKEAQQFVMPFGKYKRMTLDDIAKTDEGLKYLDWLSGNDWLRDPALSAVKAYLADPDIGQELRQILEEE